MGIAKVIIVSSLVFGAGVFAVLMLVSVPGFLTAGQGTIIVAVLEDYALLTLLCGIGFTGASVFFVRSRMRISGQPTLTAPSVCAVVVGLIIVTGLINPIVGLWAVPFPPAHAGMLALLVGMTSTSFFATLVIFLCERRLARKSGTAA